MRILCTAGARPNFIKIAALYHEMVNRPTIEPILVHTGQHFDDNMSKVFFDELQLPRPDINLNVAGGTHTWQTAQIMLRFESVLTDFSPDVVLVVGDVNSTLATSLVASRYNIPLAHVEAGLRSGDRNMPEEINRTVVDHLADLLFVTEQSGLDNLRNEGIPENKVFLVGNVMIDTLMKNLKKAHESNILQQLEVSKNHYALVTLHRPANSDNKDVLEDILRALIEISHDIQVILPIHPRTKNMMENFGLLASIKNEPNFLLTNPLGYFDFANLLSNAYVVLTDSGGIQEETTILGVPCLTIRNNTERPVTIQYGTNTLVGVKGKDIIQAYYSLSKHQNRTHRHPPLWDGNASSRIADILENRIILKKCLEQT